MRKAVKQIGLGAVALALLCIGIRFAFFQRFLKDNGILEELENLGIKEGDTVRMYGFSFDYYP